MAPPDGDRRVVMARIGAPHGVAGAVKLSVFAQDPAELRRYNPFQTRDGRTFKLRKVKTVGKSVVAELEGIGDRNAAETLRGEELSIPRSRLPRPDEDEFYYVDLIGLTACLPDGTRLGTVRSVADHGAGDILEIEGEHDMVVPFTRAVVPHIDLDAGTLTVDPPADFDDGDGEDGDGEDGAEPGEPEDGSAR